MGQVTSQRQGGVLTVTIKNPPFNFIDAAIVDELDQILRQAQGDRDLGAIVLASGLGRIFISHYEVGEILAGGAAAPFTLGPRAAARVLRIAGVVDRLPGGRRALQRSPLRGVVLGFRYQELLRRLRSLDKVTIARINGRSFGGGCELALSCDLRLMADDLDETDGIGQPEILLGIIPGGGGTQMLPRILGGGRALELMLEGRLLGSEEALATGLVHRLVAPDELAEETQRTAERLARRSPAAVAAIKRAVHATPGSLEAGLRIEAAGFVSAGTRPGATAAMERYLEWLAPRLATADPAFTQEDVEYWHSGENVADLMRLGA
jgi:enoyl-CoA hydratase/carnithine racemase